MDNIMINSIANNIITLLPQTWDKVSFRSIIDKDYYETIFYVLQHNEWIQCYDLPKYIMLSEDEIDDTFEKIYHLCIQEGNPEWTSISMNISASGKVNIDLEYDEPISFDTWKTKYLW